MASQQGYTAFIGHSRVSSGDLLDVVLEARGSADTAEMLIFDDSTGRVVDVNAGTDDEVRERVRVVLAMRASSEGGADTARPRGRGRPRLGVVSKEVTLLPRHWAWLASQRGGASAALRRLVDLARKAGDGEERVRRSQDAAYRFMSALAGDFPGYEEALRAVYAGNGKKFEAETAAWPADVRDHARLLAADALI